MPLDAELQVGRGDFRHVIGSARRAVDNGDLPTLVRRCMLEERVADGVLVFKVS
jgi:hypothetical protein